MLPFRHVLLLALALMVPAAHIAAGPAPVPTAASVRAAAEAAAGAPVRLDPRLAIPPCPAGLLYQPEAGSVRISCPATGFALLAPIARGATAGPPLVRRGDLVTVLHEGAGFAVSLEGIADGSAAAGQRVAVRNPRSGARFAAQVMPDGRLLALP